MCDVEYRETAGDDVLLHLSSVVSSGHPGGSETSTLPSLRTAEVCVCGCVYSSYTILYHLCVGNAPHSSRTDTLPSSSALIFFIDDIDIEVLSLGCLTCALLCISL